MQKTIKINGTDFTSYTPPVGYTVTPRYVSGGNTMTMQSGIRYEDEIARKSDVTVPFLPLSDAQMYTLMNTLNSGSTCSVYFFDPDRNAYRTMTAYRKVGERRFRGKGANGTFYWTGKEVTFEER